MDGELNPHEGLCHQPSRGQGAAGRSKPVREGEPLKGLP